MSSNADPAVPAAPHKQPIDKILCVGLVCLDIINHLDHYPKEDTDVRAKDQTWQSGGNAANSLKVLSMIGHSGKCNFIGTLGAGMETDFVESEFDNFGVYHDSCPRHTQCKLPTSYIILNTTNGSRSIVHYRNLPELTFEEFSSKVDLSQYSWIHFEGRCPSEYTKMVAHIAAHNHRAVAADSEGIPVSIEIEKTRLPMLDLIPLADVLLFSKDFAQYQGYSDMEAAASGFRSKAKENAVVVVAWGEKGAAASDRQGKVYSCPAFPPAQLVDTLGAGDTFNAGFIHSLSSGRTVEESLTYACKLAGAKCGMLGYEQLRHFNPESY